MKRLVLFCISLMLALPSRADERPDLTGVAIIARMNAALHPAAASTRQWELRMSRPTGGLAPVVRAVQARKRIDGGTRVLTIVTSPASLRGTAFMLHENDGARWVYAPVIERVRKLVPVSYGEAFLHSDFTYGDLGLVSSSSTYRRAQAVQGAYMIEESPDTPWLYSRIITWVDHRTFLPVRREIFDSGGILWKRQKFDDVRSIEGAPTALHIAMEDVRANTRTDIFVSAVDYRAQLPDNLFDPYLLSNALASPVFANEGRPWTSDGAP